MHHLSTSLNLFSFASTSFYNSPPSTQLSYVYPTKQRVVSSYPCIRVYAKVIESSINDNSITIPYFTLFRQVCTYYTAISCRITRSAGFTDRVSFTFGSISKPHAYDTLNAVYPSKVP